VVHIAIEVGQAQEEQGNEAHEKKTEQIVVKEVLQRPLLVNHEIPNRMKI